MTATLALLVISLTKTGFSVTVLCVKHTEKWHYFEYCAKHFLSVARSWEVYEKVVIFNMDNVYDVANILEILQNMLCCAAHILQLSVKISVNTSLESKASLLNAAKLLDTSYTVLQNSAELKTLQLELY